MNRHFTSGQVQFHAAELLLGLNYLHSQSILYRSLKPENVMIDADGYVKLVDFSNSKFLQSKQALTSTICGSSQYMAPEMVFGSRYGLEVDWWNLGIFLYELATKTLPFIGKTDTS